MLKTIWMSDLHFTNEGDVLGHDPKIRLNLAIDHINKHHQDAAFAVISGDLVNRGKQADYASLSSLLKKLSIPYFPMVGNHDDRSLLRNNFSLPNTCMDEFIQFQVQTPAGLVLCIDTQKSGSDAGEFCSKRTAWLEKILKTTNTPVFIFMHHPPMKLGLPMQDEENMENGDAFLDLLSKYECVKYLFIGHVHRPISGIVKGIPFTTMRSVLYQAPSPLPKWDWKTFKPAQEAPNLGVINIESANVILKFDQFCDYGTGTSANI